MAPLIPSLQIVTEYIRWGIHFPILPVVLIEMELGAQGLWDAIDEATMFFFVSVSSRWCEDKSSLHARPLHQPSVLRFH